MCRHAFSIDAPRPPNRGAHTIASAVPTILAFQASLEIDPHRKFPDDVLPFPLAAELDCSNFRRRPLSIGSPQSIETREQGLMQNGDESPSANPIRAIPTSPNLPIPGAQRRTRIDSPIASTDGPLTDPELLFSPLVATLAQKTSEGSEP